MIVDDPVWGPLQNTTQSEHLGYQVLHTTTKAVGGQWVFFRELTPRATHPAWNVLTHWASGRSRLGAGHSCDCQAHVCIIMWWPPFGGWSLRPLLVVASPMTTSGARRLRSTLAAALSLRRCTYRRGPPSSSCTIVCAGASDMPQCCCALMVCRGSLAAVV